MYCGSRSSKQNAYKDKAELDLERLKKHETQNVKIDLTQININTLSTLIGILSEGVQLYMKLLTANQYHALNDRTINMLSQGEVDLSATSGVLLEPASMAAANDVSDADVQELLGSETEVDVLSR